MVAIIKVLNAALSTVVEERLDVILMRWKNMPELMPLLSRMRTRAREQLEETLELLRPRLDSSEHLKLGSLLETISQLITQNKLELDEIVSLMVGKFSFYTSQFTYLTSDHVRHLMKFPTFRVHAALGWAFRAEMTRSRILLDQVSPHTLKDPYYMAEIEAIKGFIHSIRRDVPKLLAIEDTIQKLVELEPLILTHVLPLVTIRKVYLMRKTRQQIDEGITVLRELIAEQQKVGNRFFLAKAYLRLGQLYSNLGDSRNALEQYGHASTLAENLGCKYLLSIVKNRLGMHHVEGNHQDEAKRSFLEAIILARECGAKWLEAAPFISFSQFFWNRENSELALRSIEYFLSIARRMEDPQDTLAALNILAHLHGMLGHVDVAISYMIEAIEMKKRLVRSMRIDDRLGRFTGD